MEIYIVRHGETVWNKKKLLQGRTDIELSDKGRELARITGENLRDTHFDMVFSSPLKRAYETASLIVGDRDIPIVKNDLIKEMCFGNWEGQNMSELLADGGQDSSISSSILSSIIRLETANHLRNSASGRPDS